MALLLPFSTGSSLPNFRFRRTPLRSSSERQALFNRVAPFYDNLTDLLSLGQHRIWKRMSVSWSGAKMGDSVLDLCCGSGDVTFLLSEKVEVEGKVIGLDYAKDQLSVASSRQKLKSKACYMNIEWVVGDALDLPFSNGHFDAITMGYGLRNVVDKHKAMKEICRVLKAVTSSQSQPSLQEMVIVIVVVPGASRFGLVDDYKYLKRSIREFLTGEFLGFLLASCFYQNFRHLHLKLFLLVEALLVLGIWAWFDQ
uniref:2-phytyl-1,4-beta-naphthoquinone methyltransferase, chloroplastic-like isoform X1 n=1 Tax=Fragaria vesca subsp. vesca TaxID=101020 RepID=UPI0005CA365C|nr:PREDICTED: 2-phytyl-1,4-beta-naphthoquinone methyltransferase, chloroplastic-like isoform X1 [Fragaria vesca subsp. vesca]